MSKVDIALAPLLGVCSVCDGVKPSSELADCSDLRLGVGCACAECEDELIVGSHFETCGCAYCRRQRSKADAIRLAN